MTQEHLEKIGRFHPKTPILSMYGFQTIAKRRGTPGLTGIFSHNVWIDGLNGRGMETRTPDLRFWRPSLYQLSYTPTRHSIFLDKTVKNNKL
jgi:hypothetical protein